MTRSSDTAETLNSSSVSAPGLARRALLGASGMALAAGALLPAGAAAKPARDGAGFSHLTAPTQYISVNGVRIAYRRFGNKQGLPLVFSQHLAGTMDDWDPAVTDGLARTREIILYDARGVANSGGEVRPTFKDVAADTAAFIDALGLKKVDALGFSIGGIVTQMLVHDRPDLVRRVILVGTTPRNGDATQTLTPESQAIFGAKYDPPENVWLAALFTPSAASQAAGRAFLKRSLARKVDRDSPVNAKVAPAQIAAIVEWGQPQGVRFAYLKEIAQPTLVVSGNHDVIAYPINSLHLVQNLPNAELILYPDANHGSFFQYPERFVADATRFLSGVAV